MNEVVLHSDINNCYASIESLYNPSIRNKPVVVGGWEEQRHGIVLAKNYIAKKYNIQTGETLWEARQKCPDLVVVPPHYDLYLKYCKAANEIYGEYSDQVEKFGIDESWIDISGSTHLFGSGKKVADEIRHRIKYELGVTCSVGVSYNKIFAKLGSDMQKPDATTVITKDNYREKVWPLPVSDLLYVGRKTTPKLNLYNIYTIGDLAKADPKRLQNNLGKIGLMLWSFANGQDNSFVAFSGAKTPIKSVGNSTTTYKDLITDDDVKITLYKLCESVAARLREYGFVCRTVQVTLRQKDLYSFERQAKMPYPCADSNEIFQVAYELVMRHNPQRIPLRSLGVRGCNLQRRDVMQLTLFPEIERIHRHEHLETYIEEARQRFGHYCIQRGIMLRDPNLSNINPKDDHVIHPVAFLTGA